MKIGETIEFTEMTCTKRITKPNGEDDIPSVRTPAKITYTSETTAEDVLKLFAQAHEIELIKV